MSILSERDWTCIQSRYDAILPQLVKSDLDQNTRQLLQKELSQLSSLLKLHQQEKLSAQEMVELEAMYVAENDFAFREVITQEIQILKDRVNSVDLELENVLFPHDPLNDRSVFLEIRAGAGGQEAALFAADLLRAYTAYALKKRWQVSLVSMSETDLKGFREAVVQIEGRGVYGELKFESGVHRVQRVPQTETAGRVHTSTITVAVLPEAEDVDVTINPADLRIDTYRAGGAGGQHVNKTESAIRITHIPTGIVVTCQDERSQHKNKARALKVLQSRILSAQNEKAEAERSSQRKEQVGTGMRAEKVRTYNFPQNRVTDHQVDLTLKKLDMVMEGELDELIEALVTKDRANRRAQRNFSWCESVA
ncbi:MAG: Peptide chain release factor 1 [candidate division TM6 bacterium GW2011_GWE2_41_16]|nr:MAG: Peptide chain release factor 1 [candidate division TM6 bacterium GW2011_GWE2_41_16]